MSGNERRIGRFIGAALLLAALSTTIVAARLETTPQRAVAAPSGSAAADTSGVDSAGAAGDAPSDSATASEVSPREAPHPRIRITLEKGGTIDVELFPDQAPLAVERILMLVGKAYYDGLEFHRVESFLVQTGKGEGGMPPLEGEMFGQRLGHDEGMAGMARLPDDYDSATTQFYIMKERRTSLNGEYTLFGRVVDGTDVVRSIEKGSAIESIRLLP